MKVRWYMKAVLTIALVDLYGEIRLSVVRFLIDVHFVAFFLCFEKSKIVL